MDASTHGASLGKSGGRSTLNPSRTARRSTLREREGVDHHLDEEYTYVPDSVDPVAPCREAARRYGPVIVTGLTLWGVACDLLARIIWDALH